MRRLGLLLAITLAAVVTATACGGDPTNDRSLASSSEDASSAPPPPSVTAPATTPTVSPVASPIELPPGTPAVFNDDVAAADLDASALIPRGTHVEQTWITADPEAVVIAYVEPGADPFRADRGTLVWRRFGGAPAWRAVAWLPTSSETGVLGVDGLVADVTGDGLQDVLLAAYTGGSGACARWSVIDVGAADEVFARDLCDGRIDPSPDPVGLSVDQAVYRVGDPHCCPSAFRTTVLTYDGDRTWTVASKDVTPAG